MATTPQHIAREVIAGNIRSLMGRHRCTQTALGQVLHLSQPSVSQRLKGDVAFDTDELLAVAAHFNVEVTVLLEGISEQGASGLRCITTPTDRSETDISVTPCEGHLALVDS